MAGSYVIRNDNKQRAYPKGTGVMRVACATYDFAVQGGATGAKKLGVTIPKGAIIWESLIDVVTTCTTASSDAGTMAISVASANDIVSAIAVSDGSNPWDSGRHAGVPVGSAATCIKLTADCVVTATIATQAFTAGKFHIWLMYFL